MNVLKVSCQMEVQKFVGRTQILFCQNEAASWKDFATSDPCGRFGMNQENDSAVRETNIECKS